MAKPLNADWNLAQLLYSQGVAYAEIAQRLGVTQAALRQRAHRYGWRGLKTEAMQIVSQTVTRHTGKTLVQRSNEVRSSLGEDLSETVGALRQTPIKPGLDHLGERAEVAGKLAGTASRVFGWEEERPVGLVIAGMIPEPGEGPDGERGRLMAAVVRGATGEA
jgi:transposase-like protein